MGWLPKTTETTGSGQKTVGDGSALCGNNDKCVISLKQFPGGPLLIPVDPNGPARIKRGLIYMWPCDGAGRAMNLCLDMCFVGHSLSPLKAIACGC